jgi:hypothetical protein
MRLTQSAKFRLSLKGDDSVNFQIGSTTVSRH